MVNLLGTICRGRTGISAMSTGDLGVRTQEEEEKRGHRELRVALMAV